jgi:hypothetical protein
MSDEFRMSRRARRAKHARRWLGFVLAATIPALVFALAGRFFS